MCEYHAAVAACLQDLIWLSGCLDGWQKYQRDKELRDAHETGVGRAVESLLKNLAKAEHSDGRDYRSTERVKVSGGPAGTDAHDAVVKLAKAIRTCVTFSIGGPASLDPPYNLDRLDVLAANANLDFDDLVDAQASVELEAGQSATDDASFRPAPQLAGKAGMNLNQLRRFLGRHPEVETKRLGPRR
jgi:hypothetical protein